MHPGIQSEAHCVSSQFPVKVIHMMNAEYRNVTLIPPPPSSFPHWAQWCTGVCVILCLHAWMCVYVNTFVWFLSLQITRMHYFHSVTSWKAALTNPATQTVSTPTPLEGDLWPHTACRTQAHNRPQLHCLHPIHLAPTLMIIWSQRIWYCYRII